MNLSVGHFTHSMHIARPNRHFFGNYGHLFFSVFYFFPLYRSWNIHTHVEIACELLAYIVFVFIYCKALKYPSNKVLPLISVMVFICILTTQITPGTSTLFGYIAYFIGFCFIGFVRWLMLTLLLLSIAGVTLLFIPVNDWAYFIGPALVVSLGLFSFGYVEYKDRVHSDVTRKSKEQIQQLAKIAERERIARDLHDLLGHSLSSISLKSELASKFIAAGLLEKADTEAQEVAKLARVALSEVREAVSGMQLLGLTAQLDVMASRLQDKGVKVHKEVKYGAISAQKESCFCFVAKEAVTNVLKHSNASQIKISLNEQSNYHQLTVEDDGQVGSVIWGNGLRGIKSRIEELGGHIHINTTYGYKLVAQLPK
ncbi:sensor histidine kinase [Pseudoalteromonas luteoviolacea]|uniref:Signal transduction histidine kinase subgroup 3 dimerisation and phosphoacceptor domain-containing protein n=1 Tax=Pseudoalteromonas luteoviolacea S4054 TaxID=1129367 RepID=A0A0F6A915_9GAMM|nr:sensor histidine kinase [Pseudoalteromonas luteoviolacea]AOT09865.1 hypothetical protein S4054249_19430 [Pseudoalteromonas luteoviolacea]AOT14777.1 hypothetical protein S40542_19400 [Pseudoalteromonas luteoviolacea]AOT19692.1 hypothetical protein S4054_19405 [Pseudoalteromonas luteoviolacea]KKE82680.1 hypothetical protein N479_17280 [Pseudoalteromonas luteoviolacea S4054]KZN67238.1 hypothetical protein N481_24045 [Pseudoalteromonas luteoviolacea S4047-1]